MSTIYTLLPLVAKDVGVVGKTKKNQQQGYNFRAIDDVIDACHPAFTKHGVFLTSEVLDGITREERQTRNGGTMIYTTLRAKFTFYAPDGSHVVSVAPGEGMDSGDKSTNKAMSAALKYALGQTLLIPFSLVDSEVDNPDPAPRQQPRNEPQPLRDEKPPAPKGKGAPEYTCGFTADKKAIRKTVAAMTITELEKARELAGESLDNPEQAKWHARASKCIDDVNGELAEREAAKGAKEPPF